jgi:hypothetical protein
MFTEGNAGITVIGAHAPIALIHLNLHLSSRSTHDSAPAAAGDDREMTSYKLIARGDLGMTIERDDDLEYLRSQKRRYENMGMDCRIEQEYP